MSEKSLEAVANTKNTNEQKIEFLFTLAKEKLQKVEKSIGDFLRHKGVKNTKEYDGIIEGKNTTQIENIYNNEILNFKKSANILKKKELIFKLSALISQAEINEKFNLRAGMDVKGIEIVNTFAKQKEVEKELTDSFNKMYIGDKVSENNPENFEQSKIKELQAGILMVQSGKITQAEFELKYKNILQEVGKVGGLPMQARLLEGFGKIIKPLMSSGLAPMLLTLSKYTRKVLPGLPILIGGGIYASLYMTWKSDKIGWSDKFGETFKTGKETLLNIAPITGTYMSGKDTYNAIKRGDKAEIIACGIGTVVSAGFDAMTIVLVATGVGVPGAIGLQAVKNATIRGVVKFGVKPLTKMILKEGAKAATEEVAKVSSKQILKEIGKESVKFVVGNTKVVAEGIIKNPIKMVIGDWDGGKLVSKGLLHETIDGAKQIFTFKHLRDIGSNKLFTKLHDSPAASAYLKNIKKPDWAKNFIIKKFEHVNELKNSGSGIRSTLITEARIMETKRTQNDNSYILGEKTKEQNAGSTYEHENRSTKNYGNASTEHIKYIDDQARGSIENEAAMILEMQNELNLKFENNISKFEVDPTTKSTEHIIKMLEESVKTLNDTRGDISKMTTSLNAKKKIFNETYKTPKGSEPNLLNVKAVNEAEKIFKKEVELDMAFRFKDDNMIEIRRILESLDGRSHLGSTSEHQVLIYKNIENLLKSASVEPEIKILILNSLSKEHINGNLIEGKSMNEIVKSIVENPEINITKRAKLLEMLKTEKGITHFDALRSKSIDTSAQKIMDELVKSILGAGKLEGDMANMKQIMDLLKNNFYDYSKLAKSFDRKLNSEFVKVSDKLVGYFEHMPTSTKVTFVKYLKKNGVINYYLQTDAKFLDENLKLLTNSINTGGTKSIRGAFNLEKYYHGTALEEIGRINKETIVKGIKYNEVISEKVLYEAIVKNDFEIVKFSLIEGKTDGRLSAHENLKKFENEGGSDNTRLIEDSIRDTQNKDLYFVINYLYEIRNKGMLDVQQRILENLFKNINHSGGIDKVGSEYIKKYTKELIVYLNDLQGDIKSLKEKSKLNQPRKYKSQEHVNFDEIQTQILATLKNNKGDDKDLSVALCKALETMDTKNLDFSKISDFDKTLLTKKFLKDTKDVSLEKKQKQLKDILNKLSEIDETNNLNTLYKLEIINSLSKDDTLIFKKILGANELKYGKANIIYYLTHIINNKDKNGIDEISRELFKVNIYNKGNTSSKKRSALGDLGFELNIDKNGRVFMQEKGTINTIDLDLGSKYNASDDYVEMAFSKSSVFNSAHKENVTEIARYLEKLDVSLLTKLEDSGSHLNLSYASGMLLEASKLKELPNKKIESFLHEYERKDGNSELGERFVLQNIAIRELLKDSKLINESGLKSLKLNERGEAVNTYIANFMKNTDSSKLEHQLSLIKNLDYDTGMQKKAYKALMDNRLNNPDKLMELVKNPLFREIHESADMDYKFTNNAIADNLIKLINKDTEFSAKDFNEIFVLVELIKNKKAFYLEGGNMPDTIKNLKEAFTKLTSNTGDFQSKAIIDKMLEIKELAIDNESLKYFESRFKDPTIAEQEATGLINRFIEGVYKNYKASSEVTFNVRDREVLDRIQKVISKHMLALSSKGGKSSSDELYNSLDLKTKEMLKDMNVEIVGIQDGKALYMDKDSKKTFTDFDTIFVLRTETIIKAIEGHVATIVKATISGVPEGTSREEFEDKIRGLMSPEIQKIMKEYKIDIRVDDKLIAINNFEKGLKNNGNINDLQKGLFEKGMVAESNPDGSIIYVDLEDSTRIFSKESLISLSRNGQVLSSDKIGLLTTERLGTIESIKGMAPRMLNYLKGLVLTEEKDENVDKTKNIGENVANSKFMEIMSTKKAQATLVGALTLGIMTPKKLMAMQLELAEEATKEADKEHNTPEFKSLPPERQAAVKNETIRRLIVSKTQNKLDEMQLLVDKEFDIRIEKTFSKNKISTVSDKINNEVKKRFKAEMYLFMSGNPDSKIKVIYENAEGGVTNMKDFIETNIKKKGEFAMNVGTIFKKIGQDVENETGEKINWEWLNIVESDFVKEFNK